MRARTESALNYMAGLDGLRAVAVGLVIIAHWGGEQHLSWFPFGPAGVQLFFVLSGYLITGILLKYGAHKDMQSTLARRIHCLRSFYVRRMLRITPLYYLVVVAIAVIGLGDGRRLLSWNLLYMNNIKTYFHGSWYSGVGHLWSLSVEEQFYLVWPLVVLCTSRKWLARILVLLIVSAPVLRIALRVAAPDRPLSGILPFGCFDSLGVGALLAIVGIESGEGRLLSRIGRFIALPLWVAEMTLGLVGTKHWLIHEIGRSCMVLYFAAVVAYCAIGGEGLRKKLLSSRVLVYVGSLSYGLYLLHPYAKKVAEILLRKIGSDVDSGILYAMSACMLLGVASLSRYAFESPILRLKRYFPYQE